MYTNTNWLGKREMGGCYFMLWKVILSSIIVITIHVHRWYQLISWVLVLLIVNSNIMKYHEILKYVGLKKFRLLYSRLFSNLSSDILFSLFSSKINWAVIQFIIIKPTIKIIAPVYASRYLILFTVGYFKPGAGVLKRKDKQLPDPTGPLSFIIPAEAIQDANDARVISHHWLSQQIQVVRRVVNVNNDKIFT